MPRFLILTALALFAHLATAAPNVLVILADDQGWGDLSVNGNTNLSTPNIDKLAMDGARFDRFFVCPVCSPTRAEFLSGRYHTRTGVVSTSEGGERMALEEKTIADAFKAAGYHTGAFGKWHNGMQWPYHPNARGFEEFYGFCSGHWGHYFDSELEHNGELIKGNGFIVDDLTDHAIAFMQQHKSEPFFCYVPVNIPHSPMQVPDRFYRRFAEAPLALHSTAGTKEDLIHTRAALAMCENLDWNVGRLLQALDDLKLADNTIVVYFSDNGPNGWRWNGEMKGRKGSTDEGGVRSPLFIRWPGKIPAGRTIPQIAGAIDLLPTLADMSGIALTQPLPLDGRSLAPLLTERAPGWPDRMLVQHWSPGISVRSQQYRLDNRGALFDMMVDPGQLRNVAADHPDQVAAMKSYAKAWSKDTAAESALGKPFTVYGKAAAQIILPARDANATGSIKRSSRHPNCSYFTNWTSEKDTITWDAEVGDAGTYEAVIYYTCPQANTGCTISLNWRDASAATIIKEAHDPPAIGATGDRAPRTESLVKDFRPLALGDIQLTAGRGPLTLKIADIKNGQAIEVRRITLRMKK